MTAHAMTSPLARPTFTQVRPAPRRRTRVHVEMIQTPAARARRRGVVVAILLGLAAIVAPQAFAGDAEQPPVVLDTHTVATGETVWSIASDITPAGVDVRDVVEDIVTLNAMSSSTLIAGEQLLLPEVG